MIKRLGLKSRPWSEKKIPFGHSLMLFSFRWVLLFYKIKMNACNRTPNWSQYSSLQLVCYTSPLISRGRLSLPLLTKFSEVRRLWDHCRFEFELSVRSQRITERSISILCELFGTNGFMKCLFYRVGLENEVIIASKLRLISLTFILVEIRDF